MEVNPYAPPASSIQGAPELVRVDPASDFRDLSGISSKLAILLLIGLGVQVLASVASLMQLDMLSHGLHSYTRAELVANDGSGVTSRQLTRRLLSGKQQRTSRRRR